jgi:hypothetical protein
MPRYSIWFLAGFSGLIMASPALAHLHVFVDAQIAPQFAADGRIEAIKVTWPYDDLYSLMILEDHALDQDGDDLLTEAEIAGLQGFRALTAIGPRIFRATLMFWSRASHRHLAAQPLGPQAVATAN